MKEVKLEQAAYQFDAKMSLKQALPLGLQHICGESGIVPAAFVAILLNVLLPKNDQAD